MPTEYQASVMIGVLLKKNLEKIAELEHSEDPQAANFVDYLKRQNIFFRKILEAYE